MKNKKNNLLIIIVVALIIGAISFWGGMQYQKSRVGNFNKGQFSGGANNQNGNQRGQGNTQRMQPISGEITSQNETTLTIKTQDGSGKIIIYSDSTKVNKTSEGSKDDLKTGEQVMVIGIEGTDGIVMAQTISIGGNMLQGMPTGQPPDQSN